MKRNILCKNVESNYHSPPRPLVGRTGGTYGTAFWSPSHNAQVCRVPEDKWSLKVHEDILVMGIVPGNKWAIDDEFVCEDGTAFTKLSDALAHESGATVVPESVVPSGIPITREFVERAGAEQLRKLADLMKMPSYRKLPKSDDLRPGLLAFLGYEVEEQKSEVS